MFLVDFFDARSDFYSLQNAAISSSCVLHIYTWDKLGQAFISSFGTRAHLACLAPVVLNIFRGLLRFCCCFFKKKMSFSPCLSAQVDFRLEERTEKRSRFFFFHPIDQTADRSIWHQGYWSLHPLYAGCFQIQMYLNNNLWQRTNSLTNCSKTLHKHADSMSGRCFIIYLFIIWGLWCRLRNKCF